MNEQHCLVESSLAPRAAITITPEFARALELLHAGSNIFLTGKAGTGKSTLIRRFLEETKRNTITVAPTGIAALNVDGYTIHRLFSFPTGINAETVRSNSYYPGRFAKALGELDTLIIDETSMVRADLFDAMVAALERFGPKPGEPFGGVQLVLMGDLYQLPPVVRDDEAAFITERFGTPYFFSARSFDRAAFPTVELTTVFRQLGDTRLVELLNAVREGALLEDARAELNVRTDPDFDPGSTNSGSRSPPRTALWAPAIGRCSSGSPPRQTSSPRLSRVKPTGSNFPRSSSCSSRWERKS